MSDFEHYTAELVVETEDGEETIPIGDVEIEPTEDENGFREMQLSGEINRSDVPGGENDE